MTATTSDLAPVTAQIEVPVDAETAFRLYVSRPGRRHPVGGLSGAPAEIVYEPFAGGRWYEVGEDGTQHDWGRVLTWDPPRRLVLAWMVDAGSGAWAFDPDPDRASRAEITFEPTATGTLVRVVHSGFEAHVDGASIRRGVGGGWSSDLDDLARAAHAPGVSQGAITEAQVNLFCRDVEASAAFFIALGAPEAFRYPRQGPPVKIEVDAAGTRIGFDAIEEAQRIAGVGSPAPAQASAEVALWCQDVDAVHARALAVGGSTLVEPMDSPDGRLRYSWLRTPEGHQVKLVQHGGRAG